MRRGFLITGLVLLLFANLAFVYGFGTMPRGTSEGFANYFLSEAGGTGSGYQAIGSFDGVRLNPGNGVSQWRYNSPNEPLLGPEFKVGPDSLFMFKNNKSDPSCCGASFSTGGGCICTSPEQRQLLASRGGNATAKDSEF